MKAKGIERPIVPEVEAEPLVEIKSEDKKLDQMALNCMELKQNLAELQGQLSSITSANKTPDKKQEKRNKKKKNTEDPNKLNLNSEDNCKVDNETPESSSTIPQIESNEQHEKKNETCIDNKAVAADVSTEGCEKDIISSGEEINSIDKSNSVL